MRFCGAGEVFSSYQKIEKGGNSEETVRVLKLGEGSRRHSISMEGESSVGMRSFKLTKVLSRKTGAQGARESHPRMKVSIVDLLVGYQSLMQLSTSPITAHKRELHPTIGFIQQSDQQVGSRDHSKAPLYADA
eukprot:c15836_g1_i1 orf=491-889(-)